MSPRIAGTPLPASPSRESAPMRGSSPSFAQVFRDAMRAADRSRPETPRASAIPTDASRALALQAEIYRDAERVELVSKLVDHAVSAVKTLLQTRF